MIKISQNYINLLTKRDFSLLFTTIFVGQIATAFLVLTLIISFYEQTENSFAVSGVILSFTIPGLFLMSMAGLAADVFDRKKIIVVANLFITLVVFTIVFFKNAVLGVTLLSSLYFAGNTFFLPAASAATAQIAGKRNVLISNIFFIFTFAGGLILGFFLASVVNFFWGPDIALLVCLELLILAAFLSLFLSPLIPKKKKEFSITRTTTDVVRSFVFIFSRKLIFVFPLIGIGAILGSIIIARTRKKEGLDILLGSAILSGAFLLLGGILKYTNVSNMTLFVLCAVFLIVIGAGDLILVIASRIALQRHIEHNYQGTVFGTNIILASVMSSVFSLLAAEMARTLGFVNSIFIAGVFLAIGVLVLNILIKWKLSA